MQTYRKQIPDIVQYNEIVVISDGSDALFGPLSSDAERYMAWGTIDGAMLDEDQWAKLKSRWAALERVVGAEPRIVSVAADLVAHFEERDKAHPGKAMVVGMSRDICVHLYDAIVALRPVSLAAQSTGMPHLRKAPRAAMCSIVVSRFFVFSRSAVATRCIFVYAARSCFSSYSRTSSPSHHGHGFAIVSSAFTFAAGLAGSTLFASSASRSRCRFSRASC